MWPAAIWGFVYGAQSFGNRVDWHRREKQLNEATQNASTTLSDRRVKVGA